MQYAPVCGTDGQTHGNSCTARCKGAGVEYNGECGGDRGGGWPSQPSRPPWPSQPGTPPWPAQAAWSNSPLWNNPRPSSGYPNSNSNNNNQWSSPGRWGSRWWPYKLSAYVSAAAAAAQQDKDHAVPLSTAQQQQLRKEPGSRQSSGKQAAPGVKQLLGTPVQQKGNGSAAAEPATGSKMPPPREFYDGSLCTIPCSKCHSRP